MGSKATTWVVCAVVAVASPGGPVAAGGGQPLIAFVTSDVGTGKLDDAAQWPTNGGLSGLAAADAICRNHAWAAGLPGWDSFRAWMSDSSNEAYCRVHGLDGAIASNCGQGSLPTGAGPWVRVDGAPWAETIADALGQDGTVYRPLLDELGDDFGVDTVGQHAYTGTDDTGAYSGSACNNWTQSSGLIASSGTPGSFGSWRWGFNNIMNCSTEFGSLLCLQTGSGPPLPREDGVGRLAFRTSATGPGDLGTWPVLAGHPDAPTGLDAGDAVCRTLARQAFLPYADGFTAWLSTSGVDARDRFVHDGPWQRVDGVRIADDLLDLTDDGPEAGIVTDEHGAYLAIEVHTGTDDDGLRTTQTCGDWMDSGATVYWGWSSGAYGYWSKVNDYSCDTPLALYCLADSPHVLTGWDSFETGDLSRWSAAVP